MKRPYILLLALLALGIFTFNLTPVFALVKEGKTLPQMVLPDTEQQNHQLNEIIKDKVALIVYWSVSCPHCRVEIPAMLNLAKNLEGNPFILIMINNDGPEMAQAAKKMADMYGLPKPYLLDTAPQDQMPMADAFDLIATPTALLFDKHGKLIHAQEVKVDINKLKNAIGEAFSSN